MLVYVDAGSLALFLAQVAVAAGVRIDDRTQEREARAEAQDRSHRANRVAPGPAAFPGQHDEEHEGRRRDQKGRQAAEPDLTGIEGIAVRPLGNPGQQVVPPAVQRGEEVLGHPAEGAVRLQHGHDHLHTGHQGHQVDRQHAITEPFLLRAPGETVPPATAMHPGDDILEDAQRTDDRAIHPAQQQGQQDQHGHHDDIQGQNGREKLDFRQEAQPAVQRSRHIEKEQQQAGEDQRSEDDSDYP